MANSEYNLSITEGAALTLSIDNPSDSDGSGYGLSVVNGANLAVSLSGPAGPAGPAGGATAAGGAGSVQFSNGTALAADSGLVYTGTGNTGVLKTGSGQIAINALPHHSGGTRASNIGIGFNPFIPTSNATISNNVHGNIGIGDNALDSLNSTYYYNTNNIAIGTGALASLTTCQSSVFIGTYAGEKLTADSSGSTLIGDAAGVYYGAAYDNLTQATQCTFLGRLTRGSAAASTNQIVIGNGAIGDQNNSTVIGNTNTTQTRLAGNALKLGSAALNTSIEQAATGISKTITLPNATGTVPVYTDTPATGEVLIATDGSGAATWGPIGNAATSALAITYAGSWLYEYPFIIISARNFQISGVVETYSGKWIESFIYTESATATRKLTSLTFTDLEGISGSCFPNTLSAATTLSFPALKVVGGSFNPTTFALVTNLNFPQLRVVGGSVLPQGLPVLTTLTFTNLRYIGGSCLPSSMALLTTLSFPELQSVGGNFTPNSMSSLTTLTFPKLKYVGGSFTLAGYAPSVLSSLSGPMLESVGGAFSISSVSNTVTTVDYPLLAAIGGAFTLAGTPLNMTNANMDSLVTVGSTFTHTGTAKVSISYPALTSVTAGLNVSSCGSATSVSFPLLTTIGSCALSACPLVTSLNLNSLLTCLGSMTISYSGITTFSPAVLNNITTNLTLTGSNALTTINLSAMANYRGTITVQSITGLTTVTLGVIGVLKLIAGATVNFGGCALTQASVDGILALLVSLDGTNGTTLFGSGKTVTLNGGTNSTPSTAGAANRTILVGRGAIVNVN
jgi:hypothetical protein